ncbi:hypothetical protein ZWY2020_023436 [Hordeum vulgare]|nr:hypothetical protein ZWY2020_023436 [Hordeum vulgare]
MGEEVSPFAPSPSRSEEPWSLYFRFPSKDAAQKYGLVKMYERDISYGSLLNVMVRNRYGSDDIFATRGRKAQGCKAFLSSETT